MGEAASIFRKANNTEKGDMTLLGEKNLNWFFKKKNEAKQSEYTVKHKPYCFRCAKLDFEDAIDTIKREAHRHKDGSGITIADVEAIYKKDLDEYAKDDRFELVRTEPANEDKLLDGIKQSVKIGEYKHFVCKERGCKFCVFVPNKVLSSVSVKK